MATNQSSLPRFQTTLDPFNKLKVKIALELTRVDVRVLKSAFVGKIPNEYLNKKVLNEEVAGLDLLDDLQLFGFFSENNLSLLKEGLETANRIDLVTKLEEFSKTVTEVRDAPMSQMEKLPAPGSVLLHLLMTGPRDSITDSRIQVLQESLRNKLSIKVSDVPILRRNETDQDCTFVILQFPSKEEQIDHLIIEAANKAEWLVNLGVLRLQINGKASISIDENMMEVRQAPQRETRVLEMRADFILHCDEALDLILLLEVPFSVTPNVLKKMAKHCQSSVNTLSQAFDMRLAIVTYGNHGQQQSTDVPAFLSQDFSRNYDLASHVKNEGQRGGKGGPSGLADALTKVGEISGGQSVRKEATKLCILINFLVDDTLDLDFYKCSHGNDVIQRSDNLADNGVTLYIFGVSLPQQGNVTKKEKNFFLEGIAEAGGGRYFQLENVEHLDQAISCVTKHDVSIEKQGKTTGAIVKDDITNNHGIIRFNGLPIELKEKLKMNGVTVDTLKENGRSLEEVSKLAQQVSFSDSLDELIKSLGTSKIKPDPQSRSCKKGSGVGVEFGEPSGIAEHQPHPGKRRKQTPQACSISVAENRAVDLECATRIMRRQLHRLAYVEITDPEDQEMMQVDNKDIKH